MNDLPYITLKNGVAIPAIGLGPGYLSPYVDLNSSSDRTRGKGLAGMWKRAIKRYRHHHLGCKYFERVQGALEQGFRLLDYKPRYGSEHVIAKVMNECGIPREKLFLSSSAWHSALISGDVRASLMETLSNLKTEYLDLYMLPWPQGKYVEAFFSMQELQQEGYIRCLGVGNFHIQHLERLEKELGILPDVNQIEIHPLLTKKHVLEYCRDKSIIVESYSPIARHDFRLFQYDILHRIAEHHHKSAVQVILRWHVQQGLIPIIKTLNPYHQREALQLGDFELSRQEMDIIDSFNINSCLWFDPDNHPNVKTFDYHP